MNRSLALRFGSWLAVLVWAGIICVLSSISGAELQQLGFNVWDKLVHFIAFLLGGVALTFALRVNTTWSWRRIIFVAILGLAAFAAFDEWHQLYTPHRSGGDRGDWIADTLGAIAGVIATVLFYARFTCTDSPAPAGD